MKKVTLFLMFIGASLLAFPQVQQRTLENPPPRKLRADENKYQQQQTVKNLKTGEELIFWEEQFDWEDPTVEAGWKLPDGWTVEDPTDVGYHWHWANDTLKGVYTNEPIMNSTSAHNGVLALNLDGYNSDIAHYSEYLAVDNSIISPPIDCSGHASVLVRVEQRFRYWSGATMLFEVTNDAGVHWAAYDMKMGTLISETVAGLGPQEKVDLYLNVTSVAAGMPEVQFRITWRDARLYYWMIDDIVFMEGWDHDLQMLYYEADYDNGTDDPEGFFYQVPYNQLSGYDFHSIVWNFGNEDQWGTHMNVKVTKNNQVIWDQNTDPILSVALPDVADTLYLKEQFVPEDFGHYQIDITVASESEDERPDDNSAVLPFHVTDSVFSRSDTTREQSFSTWGWYTVDHEGDFMGTWYTLKEDVEINSITAYINGADVEYSIMYALFGLDEETGDPIELLVSDLVGVDSTILENHWLTLPLEKDGEGEFLEAGKSYMAAVYFSSPMTYEEAYDSRRYSIGSDRSNFYPSGKCWYYFAVDDAWYSSGSDLFMIAMNFNDDSNIIDGTPLTPAEGFMLEQNYPNPFADQTTIQFSLPVESDIEFIIMDLTGRKVYEQSLGSKPAGINQIELNAKDFESGTYFYTVKGENFKQTKQMIITK